VNYVPPKSLGAEGADGIHEGATGKAAVDSDDKQLSEAELEEQERANLEASVKRLKKEQARPADARPPGREKHDHIKKIDPFDIRFTHDSIKKRFRSGTMIDDAIRDIRSGTMTTTDFPPLDVTECPQDHRLYSFSNRRLFMCRVLGNIGNLQQVDVIVHPFDCYWVKRKWRYACTTQNEGTSVVVASDFTRDQWPCRRR